MPSKDDDRSQAPGGVTDLLLRWNRGDATALERLMPLVYDELHRLAERSLRRERRGHTLQPTALVHEAYLRLVDQKRVAWKNRGHFFAVAAQAMRRVLVDYARRRRAEKRGGRQTPLTLEIEAVAAGAAVDLDLLALDEALGRLESMDAAQARIVELRFFAGLSIEETAEVLETSSSSVKRGFRSARAWLFQELAVP